MSPTQKVSDGEQGETYEMLLVPFLSKRREEFRRRQIKNRKLSDRTEGHTQVDKNSIRRVQDMSVLKVKF